MGDVACDTTIRLNGRGNVGVARPQIAAAVALWYEKYKNLLPRDWRRVEAVRNALIHLGRAVGATGSILAMACCEREAALGVAPRFDLAKTPADNDSFAFLRVLTGLGILTPPRERMFNLELTQRWLINPELQETVPDPEKRRSPRRAA